jgi:hypothetical protein
VTTAADDGQGDGEQKSGGGGSDDGSEPKPKRGRSRRRRKTVNSDPGGDAQPAPESEIKSAKGDDAKPEEGDEPAAA